jgi:hypothetical protein
MRPPAVNFLSSAKAKKNAVKKCGYPLFTLPTKIIVNSQSVIGSTNKKWSKRSSIKIVIFVGTSSSLINPFDFLNPVNLITRYTMRDTDDENTVGMERN